MGEFARELTQGDTYPPIRFSAVQTGGKALMPVGDAEELHFLAVPRTTGDIIEGKAGELGPVEDVGDDTAPLGYNVAYDLEEGDTGTPDTYDPWLKIVWDGGSSPPRVEWVRGTAFIVNPAPESQP